MKYWEIEEIYNVVFWSRSGSYLLHSLLDSHPNLLSLPINNWYSYYQTFVELIAIILPENKNNPDFLANAIAAKFPFLFNDWDLNQQYPRGIIAKVGDDNRLGVEKQPFIENLSLLLQDAIENKILITRGVIIKAIHCSYAKILKRKCSDSNLKIVLSLHIYTHQTLEVLYEDFKFVKIISTIRNPVFGFDSHLFHHMYESIIPPQLNAYTVVFSMLFGSVKSPSPIKPEDFIAVKFEDMHLHTEITMRALARWMKIEWDPCLMQSSLDGKIWWYDRRGELITGTNSQLKDSSLKVMSSRDVLIYKAIFKNIFEHWKYPIGFMSKLSPFAFLLCLFPTHVLINALKCDLKSARNRSEKRALLKKFYSLYWLTIKSVFKSMFDVSKLPFLNIKKDNCTT